MSTARKLFKNRPLLIATMHGKEKIISSLLEQQLGVKVFTTEQLNTDLFGTFSGEIERQQSQPDTARLKIEEAARLTGADLVLASEGTFQPHHLYYIATGNYEMVMLKDFQNNAEWQGWEVSLKVAANSYTFSTPEEAIRRSKTMKFPSHGMLIRSTGSNGARFVEKGITEKEKIAEAATNALAFSIDGTAIIENDLRAHMNPTRQKTILAATHNLVTALKADCPGCEWPGFRVEERIPGLPCSACGAATRLTLHEIFTCDRCSHRVKKNRSDGKVIADPYDCDRCNP
jgi:hypothetical protein